MKMIQDMAQDIKTLSEKILQLEEKITSNKPSGGPITLTITVTGLPPFVSKEDLTLRISIETDKCSDVVVKLLEILKGKGLKLARKEDFALFLQLPNNKRAELDPQEILSNAVRENEHDMLVLVYKKK
jgi:hypothetical protein